jgi:hypothetical protein
LPSSGDRFVDEDDLLSLVEALCSMKDVVRLSRAVGVHEKKVVLGTSALGRATAKVVSPTKDDGCTTKEVGVLTTSVGLLTTSVGLLTTTVVVAMKDVGERRSTVVR